MSSATMSPVQVGRELVSTEGDGEVTGFLGGCLHLVFPGQDSSLGGREG